MMKKDLLNKALLISERGPSELRHYAILRVYIDLNQLQYSKVLK